MVGCFQKSFFFFCDCFFSFRIASSLSVCKSSSRLDVSFCKRCEKITRVLKAQSDQIGSSWPPPYFDILARRILLISVLVCRSFLALLGLGFGRAWFDWRNGRVLFSFADSDLVDCFEALAVQTFLRTFQEAHRLLSFQHGGVERLLVERFRVQVLFRYKGR